MNFYKVKQRHFLKLIDREKIKESFDFSQWFLTRTQVIGLIEAQPCLYNSIIFMAMHMIELYFSRKVCTKKAEVQLILATCIWMTCKIEGRHDEEGSLTCYEVHKLIANPRFKAMEMVQMEREIIKNIHISPLYPHTYTFLHVYLEKSIARNSSAVKREKVDEKEALRYAKLSLTCLDLVGVAPSLIAKACLQLAGMKERGRDEKLKKIKKILKNHDKKFRKRYEEIIKD